jgi:ankyrin repeat protein
VAVVSLLLASGADPNAKNNDGQTALFVAASRGVDDVVAVLMSNGADPDVTDTGGRSPLHVAMVMCLRLL